MTHALHTSALKSLPLLARGKVRDNYAVGDDRLLARLAALRDACLGPLPARRPDFKPLVAALTQQ